MLQLHELEAGLRVRGLVVAGDDGRIADRLITAEDAAEVDDRRQ